MVNLAHTLWGLFIGDAPFFRAWADVALIHEEKLCMFHAESEWL
jgi:hypothetical protein